MNPTKFPDKGHKFVCDVCGKTDVMDKTRQEMIATYETLYQKEFRPEEVVLTCTQCDIAMRAVRFGVVKETT